LYNVLKVFSFIFKLVSEGKGVIRAIYKQIFDIFAAL